MIGEEAKRLATVTRFMLLLITSILFLKIFIHGEILFLCGLYIPIFISFFYCNNGKAFPHTLHASTKYFLYYFCELIALYGYAAWVSPENDWYDISVLLSTAINQNFNPFIIFVIGIILYEIGFRDYLFYKMGSNNRIGKEYSIAYLEMLIGIIIIFDLYISPLLFCLFMSIFFVHSLILNFLRSLSNSVIPGICLKILLYLYANYYLLCSQIELHNFSLDWTNSPSKSFLRVELFYYSIIVCLLLQAIYYARYFHFQKQEITPIHKRKYSNLSVPFALLQITFMVLALGVYIPLFITGLYMICQLPT